MSYWGEVWSLLSAFLWASAVILFRIAVKSIPPIEMGLFKNTLALLLFFFTWMFWPDLDTEAALTRPDVVLLITSGVLGIALGDTLFLHSLSYLGASRNAIIGCLFSPFVILLSFLFLGERFTLIQSLGFLLILAGIFLAVYQKSEGSITKRALYLGTLTGVLSIFFMASGMVITKPIVTDSSAMQVAWIRLSGGVLGLFLYTVIRGKLFQSLQVFKSRLPWKVMFLGAFLGSCLALYFWILGFKYTAASTASILNQTSVIFILILAAIFLNERLRPLKIAAAILSFTGVLLIFLHA